MKTIKESIIGRRGTQPSKLWLLYPVGGDFHTALDVLPDDCRIYWDATSLFCVNLRQLKDFFDNLSNDNRFTGAESSLFEINSRYLRSFKDVKDWIVRLSSTEDFDLIYEAKELNPIVNIPKYIESL